MSFIEEKGHLQYRKLFICVILRGCLFQGYFVHFKTSKEYILILRLSFPTAGREAKLVSEFSISLMQSTSVQSFDPCYVLLCAHIDLSTLKFLNRCQCLVLHISRTQAPDLKNHLNHKRKRLKFLCNLSCLLVTDSFGLFGQVFSGPAAIQAGVLY